MECYRRIRTTASKDYATRLFVLNQELGKSTKPQSVRRQTLTARHRTPHEARGSLLLRVPARNDLQREGRNVVTLADGGDAFLLDFVDADDRL